MNTYRVYIYIVVVRCLIKYFRKILINFTIIIDIMKLCHFVPVHVYMKSNGLEHIKSNI